MKKFILLISVLAVLVLVGIFMFEMANQCSRGTVCRSFTNALEPIAFVLIIPLVLLPFSLATYRMKDEVFKRWVKFSAWFIPLLVLAHFVFSGSGSDVVGAIQNSFNMLALGILYAIYVIVSIVKIVRTYRRTKNIASSAIPPQTHA